MYYYVIFVIIVVGGILPQLMKTWRMTKMEKKICTRCGGSGYLPHMKHVEGGRCFKCGGLGYSLVDKEQKVSRNKMEYVIFLDGQSEIIAIRKFEKPLSMNKAMEMAPSLIDTEYSYMNICTEEQLEKANLLKEVE